MWPYQRAGNGYIRGDFGAGSVAGSCNRPGDGVGDTCSVSNTFTKSGYGTVKPGDNIVSNNGGIWANGSGSVGSGMSNKVSKGRCKERSKEYVSTR